MADRRKCKVSDNPSLEIIPPPSTQPPTKKSRPNVSTAPPNFPSSLRPVFAPASHTSSALSSRPNSAFSSQPAKSRKSSNATTTAIATASTKAKGKAKAKPQVDSDQDDNSSNSNDKHDDSLAHFAKNAADFKVYLASQINSNHGAARQETNDQGGKGPSARARAKPTSASAKGEDNSEADQLRPLKPSEWWVPVVMILPNGVVRVPRDQRNKYESRFDIRGHAFWRKDLAYLTCEGFTIHDPNGFVFDDKWLEEQVFEEIRSILPDAAQQLINNHHPAKDGPRSWLPCMKESYNGKFIVDRASGPFTGAVMRNISLHGNQRGVSTTQILLSGDSEVSENDAAVGGPSTPSAKPAKSGSHSTQPSKPAASSDRVLRSTQLKNTEIITVSDYSLEADSDDTFDWHTEPAFSCAGSPQDDLDRSFSGIHLDISSPHNCHPELPAEAVYCLSP
ncbi:hypothetical protein BJ165DRAFT_1524808 [Panaeolus papilionaceus]|nr:hypothetical protein BJ165DRAFT_1524808 [Panaeolus papilionaceus]